MLFSLRNKLLDDKSLLIRFRNRVWNTFSTLIEIYYDACSLKIDMDCYDAAYTLLFDIADRFGRDVADSGPYVIYKDLHEELNHVCEYNRVYDFIEAVIETLFDHPSLSYGVRDIDLKRVQVIAVRKYRQLLRDENQPFQLYKNKLIPFVSDLELSEIERATATDYDSVDKHIEKAWTLFSNRKSPDYENSIKESISAVEAICCTITGMTGKATLRKAINKLESSGVHIHHGLVNAFSSLYGYTCDENGIRHGGIDFTNAPAEDAKYMLISCSAFVNYLIEKWEKIEEKG